MQAQTLELRSSTPGQRHSLTVLRFGRPGAAPKATIQAALHADEVPAMLVAQQLRSQLAELEAAAAALHGRLGDDEAANTRLVRQALRDAAQALQSMQSTQPAQDLKHQLLRLAVDSDVVLDLHCDGEAAMHLYTLTPHAALGAELGALLGAQAVLLAIESGDSPFDEACSRPWLLLRERLPPRPVPLACFGATVELRGEADTSHEPTPLAASEPVSAPAAGIVVFHRRPGDRVEAGTVIADLVDADSGAVTPVRAESAGLLYARIATRWATPGCRLAKIAGTQLQRSGKLLSP